MRPSERIFGEAMSAINGHKARHGGQPPEIKDVAKTIGVAVQQIALAVYRTRKRSPETAALFYQALGQAMPEEKPAKPRKPYQRRKPDDEQLAGAGSEPADDEDTDAASVLHQCVAWISKSELVDRTRIVATLAVYFRIPGAAALLEQSSAEVAA